MTCPICNARVKETTINAHIDNNCKDPLRSSVVDGKGKQNSSTNAVSQWNKIMGGAGSAKKRSKGESVQIDTETYVLLFVHYSDYS